MVVNQSNADDVPFPPWVSPHLFPSSKPSATTINSPSACRPLPTCLHGCCHAPLCSFVPHHIRHINPAQHHPDLDSSDQPRQRRSILFGLFLGHVPPSTLMVAFLHPSVTTTWQGSPPRPLADERYRTCYKPTIVSINYTCYCISQEVYTPAT